MSTLAIILVIMGSLIVLTRGPLVFAPTRTRDTYMRLFDSDKRMRGLGVLFTALSALVIWSLWGVAGITAQVILYLGGLIFFVGFVGMILFPGPSRKMASAVWGGFNGPTLRVLGLLAVVFGAWLIFYGLSL